MGIVGLCHVFAHALVQTVIQSYSPSEFRGRTIAIFHMSQVVMTVGAMLPGVVIALRRAVGCGIDGHCGSVTMIGIYVMFPRARLIR